MPWRPCVLAALGAALVLPARISAQPPVDPRADLEIVQAALDGAVAKVSRNGVSFVVGGADSCRSYHLQGLGAIFILAPRALPEPGNVVIVRRQVKPSVQARRETSLGPDDSLPAAEGHPHPVPLGERDLREFEEEAEALQLQAERNRQQAELELEAIAREFQALRGATPVAPAPLPPGAQAPVPSPSAALPPPWPPPPWRFWFRGQTLDDPRPPGQVISDVRAAVTDVLEGQASHLRIVRPEESVVVAVDFVPGSPFLRPRPLRTLVVRVRKKELEERAAGKLAPEELHRRIEYVEY